MSKKFSITQLETARKSPTTFASILKSPSNAGGFGKSKFTDWKNAVYFYHKTNDINGTMDYFEQFFHKHFKENRVNSKDFEKYTKAIEKYIAEYQKQNFIFIESKKNIDFEIVQNKLSMSGQVPMINLNKDSTYSLYFFYKYKGDWEEELRFPIVQDYFANNIYGVDTSEIKVGIYALDIEKHFLKTFSKSEIKSARNELDSIGQTIAVNL